jgi:hypothetical protein
VEEVDLRSQLVDLLEGNRYLWLRFSIGDAKGAWVERLWWEHGPITNYATEEADHGKRLARPAVRHAPSRRQASSLSDGRSRPSALDYEAALRRFETEDVDCPGETGTIE